MDKLRKLIATSALCAVAAAGSLMLAGPAQAAVAPYNGVCGTGYNVVNQADIGNKGTVYLTYNNSTGRNCAVTVRATPGAAVEMVVSVVRSGDNPANAATDAGYFTTYAGPVYLSAAGRCVDWYGYIDGTNEHRNNTNCG
ncbi:spore-associated protein A [Nocardiopsis sp. CT-R113]|uniref:Spore-associated protein A n=1 Tax=Nocardiopsis codii TaxID=3065942 RepID=A0ABU7K3G3_9ACTN|nr:spore-associated protein A [Nocardiopsis sp. CT-R113]MEE2036768.1 spore-associated protein A [Nocardiopsis sp. CT-R113]